MLIRILIGVALLVAVCWSVDLQAVTAAFARLRPEVLVAFAIAAIADRILMAYKWNLLVRAQDIYLSVWQATRLYFVGHLLGTFTPGAIGADAYRVAALTPFKKTPIVISTILLERFIGLAVVGVFAAAALPFSAKYLGADSTTVVVSVVAASAMIVAGLLISFRPKLVEAIVRRIPFLKHSKIRAMLAEVYHAYADSRRHTGLLASFAALTVIELLLTIFVNYLAALALGIEVSFVYFLCVLPLLYILVRLPITFQGIGVMEGLFAYFLSVGGFSAADGLAIAFLLRLSEIFLGFIPAAIMLWLSPFRIRPDV